MAKTDAAILLVDDDEAVRTAGQLFLKQLFRLVMTTGDPAQIPALMREIRFDAILLDMNFGPGRNDGKEGLHWLEQILQIDPGAVVVLITAYGDVDLAVSAMRSGAFDFIVKPWKNDRLSAVIRTALKMNESQCRANKYKQQQETLQSDLDRQSGSILGESMAMERVRTTIDKVAPTDANILLLGENGSGKEIVAREIHRQSARSAEVFMSVDMGAVHENLFESELFGHEKGAFTDARQARAGRFEVAEGGTLFLDEIGNLSLPLQAKLLSALENRKLVRVGGNRERPMDVRLISATNMPLYDMAHQKTFREDLLYRMNTVEIRIPPLRERHGDIPLLANYFLEHYARKYQRPGLRIPRQMMKRLGQYSWPGNIRELRHAVERAVILSESESLDFGDLRTAIRTDEEGPDTLNLQDMEKRYILKAISRNRGNMTRAADDLGLARAALYRRMQKYGL